MVDNWLTQAPELSPAAWRGLPSPPHKSTLSPEVEGMMRARAILETVLYASDLAAAEAFYARIFGLEVAQRLEGKFVFFRMAEQMLLIFDPQASATPGAQNPIPRHGAAGAGHLCFRAESHVAVEAWHRHLVAHGIEIEADHRWPNGARSIYLRDPAGNSIEIGEARMWGLERTS